MPIFTGDVGAPYVQSNSTTLIRAVFSELYKESLCFLSDYIQGGAPQSFAKLAYCGDEMLQIITVSPGCLGVKTRLTHCQKK